MSTEVLVQELYKKFKTGKAFPKTLEIQSPMRGAQPKPGAINRAYFKAAVQEVLGHDNFTIMEAIDGRFFFRSDQ